MADDRELRRLLNTKQDVVEFKGEPSISGMAEGQIAITKSNNSQLAVHRKKYGKLWKSYMSYNGDQYIERNLEVKGKLETKGKVTLYPEVGIGVSEPDQMVHIEHPTLDTVVRIGAPTDKTSAIQLYSDGGDHTWQMGVPFNADKFVIDEASISSGDDLVIYTGGIVLMGRTSPAASTKDPVLEVDGYVSFDGFVDRAGTGGSDNGDNIINFNWDGSQLEGWVDTTEVQSNITSDYRIKENVTDVSSGVLEKINSLRPIHYTQKECGIFGQSDKQRTSFIAHEMQEVLPDIINGDKDAVDENDNPIFQGYKHQDLTAYLIKAVQELSAKVTALENN